MFMDLIMQNYATFLFVAGIIIITSAQKHIIDPSTGYFPQLLMAACSCSCFFLIMLLTLSYKKAIISQNADLEYKVYVNGKLTNNDDLDVYSLPALCNVSVEKEHKKLEITWN